MANPARKPTPNIRPNIRPSFTVITGGGQTTPDRGSLRAVNDQEENPEEIPQQTSEAGGKTKIDKEVILLILFKLKGPFSVFASTF